MNDAHDCEKFQANKTYEYLQLPLFRTYESTFYSKRGHCSKFTIRTYDQPGRWMTSSALNMLRNDLYQIAEASLDAVPDYGVFQSNREVFENRIISIAYESEVPVGFTALCYLPPVSKDSPVQNDTWQQNLVHFLFTNCFRLYQGPILHLGLTMIKNSHRGKGIQSSIFLKSLLLPVFNQRKLFFCITNIAASPAGIGAVSDYFFMSFPHYQKFYKYIPSYHLTIARHVLANYRHEFGCSTMAKFEEDIFVVRQSNEPTGGGASAFIKEDGKPVSQYKNTLCNKFCASLLRLPEGDELFQVAVYCPLISIVQYFLTNASSSQYPKRHSFWSFITHEKLTWLFVSNVGWGMLACISLVIFFAWSRSILLPSSLYVYQEHWSLADA
eukprot:jgi/Galph1/4259/GphlegSOOS_G2943.1